MNHLVSFSHKKIGIWGLGISGKAIIVFLKSQGATHITLLEQRQLSQDELLWLAHENVDYIKQVDTKIIYKFWQQHEIIIPSPGIDIRPYLQYKDTLITELDLLAFYIPSCLKVLGITGTIGKTTVTAVLSDAIAKYNPKTFVGGNIGTSMLDVVAPNASFDYCVLELSSFQLEHTRTFTPDIAICTTLYPNHLDRHANVREYLDAKLQLFARQSSDQIAIIPLTLIPFIIQEHGSLGIIQAKLICTHPTLPSQKEMSYLPKEARLVCADELMLNKLSPYLHLTFIENLIIIAAALEALNIPIDILEKVIKPSTAIQHRLELLGTYQGISFFNDSKATIMQATIPAVQQLQPRPVILLLGGLSKGVDRSPYIEQLKGKVKAVICFGKEAQQLQAACLSYGIHAITAHNLQEAFMQSCLLATNGDVVLLSPGGSSYDLFAHYQERGQHFAHLVKEHYKHI